MIHARYGTCDAHTAVHAFRNDPDPCIGWADAPFRYDLLGRHVSIPTIEGDRAEPTYGKVLGMDADNYGHVIVATDRPVMGTRHHSIAITDITLA